ncbi:MAG: hypothetical protein IJX76_00160 [Clostridia bacterium]|nr:hypothetical protein [Clostridia bacterium]
MRDEKHTAVPIDRPDDDFAPLISFAQESRRGGKVTYEQFDAATVRRLNLFVLRESFDFDGLEATLDRILRELPAIKRIFARPIIRLRDTTAILPVESVRVVNNQTIVHASSHSELWGNITEDEVTPRKLMTVQNEDHYAIYENLAFARAVNIILQFVGRNMRELINMLYADRDMQFNLLERLNHLEYFLAIGKLHIGYVRDYDKYRTAADRCLDKLLFIDRVIRARLRSPVYQQCKKYKGALTLKKTNVFRMHKDYHRIYLLLKWFADEKIGDPDEEDVVPAESGEGYGIYCAMLTLFAAGHFNFTFDSRQTIDFYNLRQTATFDRWLLSVETVTCEGISALRISVTKDRTYRVLLLPATHPRFGKMGLSLFYGKAMANEYLTITPEAGEDGQISVSIHDVESFRRLQQILLRGMIYADVQRKTCPFCGGVLTASDGASEDSAYECVSCRTVIRDKVCPDTGIPYVETSIKNFRPDKNGGESARRDHLLYTRYVEAQMHFRNVTPLDDVGKPLCPRCGKVH